MTYTIDEQLEIEDLMNSAYTFDSYASGFHEYIPGDHTRFEPRDPVQREIDLVNAHMWQQEHLENHERKDQVPTSSDWDEPLSRSFVRTPSERWLASLARPLYDEDPNVLTDEEFEMLLDELNHGPRLIKDTHVEEPSNGRRYATIHILLSE